MRTFYDKIKSNKKKIIFLILIILGGVYYFLHGGKTPVQTFEVKSGSIEQSVALSGKIETTDKADLGFAASGRIAKIPAKNNTLVKEGTVLAQLEIGDLLADLEIQQANSRTSDVDVVAAKDNLDKVTAKENTNVANAYRTLLSSDLVLTPDTIKYNLSAPTVTGLYTGGEGTYRINFDRERSDLDVRMLTFGLEMTKNVLNYEGQTPIGTKGLYISFPVKDPAPYENTYWDLTIPNKSGSSYVANFNAYNAALNERDIAIKNAQADYDKLLSRGDSGTTVAQAQIDKIQAEIKKSTIYAPFSGRVTNIEKQVGENAAVGEQVVTVLGENKLQVVLQVSELDVSKLVPGAHMQVSIDAIPGETFDGVLKTVNSRDTQVQGVPVYEAYVQIPADNRVKTGMNAKGVIVLEHKDNVLSVPVYAITKDGADSYVDVMLADEKTEHRKVTTGITGSDSMVEILSGLNAGEKVIINKK